MVVARKRSQCVRPNLCQIDLKALADVFCTVSGTRWESRPLCSVYALRSAIFESADVSFLRENGRGSVPPYPRSVVALDVN